MIRTNRDGFVLVCVLWVLAIMTVLALGFGRRAFMDRAAATYTLDHAKAMQMARGAVARGIITLQNKAAYDVCNKTMGRTSYRQEWAKPMDLLSDQSLFGEITKDEVPAASQEPESEEENKDICMYSIRDESGLISINSAPDEMLDKLKGMSRSVVRKINARRAGELDEEPGYSQTFQSIEEVRDFADISDREWFGDDREPGLRDLITCWGDKLINVNTASEAVLKAIPRLADKTASAIVEYRKGADGELFTADDQDFVSLEDVVDKLGTGQGDIATLKTFCKVDSQFFTITGVATRRQGKITASCVATVEIQDTAANIFKWREELVEP